MEIQVLLSLQMHLFSHSYISMSFLYPVIFNILHPTVQFLLVLHHLIHHRHIFFFPFGLYHLIARVTLSLIISFVPSSTWRTCLAHFCHPSINRSQSVLSDFTVMNSNISSFMSLSTINCWKSQIFNVFICE